MFLLTHKILAVYNSIGLHEADSMHTTKSGHAQKATHFLPVVNNASEFNC